MAKDVIDLLEDYIPESDQEKWAKLSSTVESRRLELLLLKEILLELREIDEILLEQRERNKARQAQRD